MQCAPCSLNTDNYADRRKDVVNATIMHNNISDIEQIYSHKRVLWSTVCISQSVTSTWRANI